MPRYLHIPHTPATGWMRRYDQEFDPDNPAPQKLQPYLADAKTLVQKLLADYKEATAAPQTELIDQADRQRDALIAQISTMIEAMLKMTLMPQKQQAAQTLKTGWDIYKPTAKAALRDESTQVQQWLEYVHAHEVGDELPDGWKVGKLGDIVDNYDSKRIPIASDKREI